MDAIKDVNASFSQPCKFFGLARFFERLFTLLFDFVRTFTCLIIFVVFLHFFMLTRKWPAYRLTFSRTRCFVTVFATMIGPSEGVTVSWMQTDRHSTVAFDGSLKSAFSRDLDFLVCF